MARDEIEAVRAGLDKLLADKLRLRRGTLREKLRRARRMLPRDAVRALEEDLAYLDAAERRTAHPKRHWQVDTRRLREMLARHEKQLGKLDLSRERARARLNWLGGLVLNLMLFAVVYLALLRWLGAI